MTDNTQSEALRLAEWLDDQYDPDHRKAEAATELRRLYTENVALQQVLVAAQMKIDHFRDATKMVAPSGEYPPSAAYAELPIPSGVSDDGYNLFLLTQMRDFADRTHALRASHGQAPTHANVAGQCEDAIELLGKYKDLCEEIKRGDSYHIGRIDAAISMLTQAVPQREAFEDWHIEQLRSQCPADSATTPASGEVAYLDIGAGGYLDLGTDLSNEALSRLPNGRHALVIAGTYGIDGYVPTPTRRQTA